MKQVASVVQSAKRRSRPGQAGFGKTSESAFRGFRRRFCFRLAASGLCVCGRAFPGMRFAVVFHLEPCDSSRTACQDSAGDRILPSNGIDPAWFGDAKAALEPTQDLVIDTDLGTVVTLAGNQQLTDVSYHQVNAADCGKSWKVGIGVFF